MFKLVRSTAAVEMEHDCYAQSAKVSVTLRIVPNRPTQRVIRGHDIVPTALVLSPEKLVMNNALATTTKQLEQRQHTTTPICLLVTY